MSFGSKSSSSSSTTNNTMETTVTTVDNRVAEDNAAVGGNVTTGSGDINGSLTISTTDQGAIRGGVDLAQEAIRSAGSSLATVESVTKDTISQAYTLANQARQSETSAALNNFLKYGVWVAVTGIAAYVIVKGSNPKA